MVTTQRDRDTVLLMMIAPEEMQTIITADANDLEQRADRAAAAIRIVALCREDYETAVPAAERLLGKVGFTPSDALPTLKNLAALAQQGDANAAATLGGFAAYPLMVPGGILDEPLGFGRTNSALLYNDREVVVLEHNDRIRLLDRPDLCPPTPVDLEDLKDILERAMELVDNSMEQVEWMDVLDMWGLDGDDLPKFGSTRPAPTPPPHMTLHSWDDERMLVDECLCCSCRFYLLWRDDDEHGE